MISSSLSLTQVDTLFWNESVNEAVRYLHANAIGGARGDGFNSQ